MNDILSIVVPAIFSCIILDILGYVLRSIGIPEPSWLCLRDLDGLHNDINNLKFKIKQND